MKSKIQKPIISILSLILIGFIACKNPTQIPAKESSDEILQIKEKENDTAEPQIIQKNKKAAIFKTLLRPDEEIKIGKEYIDTVHFINYNDNLDYWYFSVKKNKDTINITYDEDESISKLTREDKLIIKWKLKYLENAGDPELSEIKPFLISFTPISSKKLTDKKEKINKTFVISCGSGCALTYSEHKIEKINITTEVTFKVEMYINEKLSDEYLETYIFNCEVSNQSTIRLKGNSENSMKNEHPEILRKMQLYSDELCN